MKKDGIQTRNRKLATKAKRRKSFMHDFFRSSFDSRFMYSNMGPSYLAAAAASNPMSQYYAGQMSAMQPFMGTAASHLDMTHAAAAHNSSSPSPSSNGELYHGQSAYPSAGGGEDAAATAAAAAAAASVVQAQTISSNGNGIAENGASGGGGGGSATSSMIGASA